MRDKSILGVKTWRQERGIRLEDVSASTKLSMRHLEAIESGDFKRLPGGIYNTNYIRQYAKAIAFDESELLSFYENAVRVLTPGAALSNPLFQH